MARGVVRAEFREASDGGDEDYFDALARYGALCDRIEYVWELVCGTGNPGGGQPGVACIASDDEPSDDEPLDDESSDRGRDLHGLDQDDLDALYHEAAWLHRRLENLRPWTVFVSCSGDGQIWVRAGSSKAHRALIGEIGTPFAACTQCGDTAWRDWTEMTEWRDGPPTGVHVIGPDVLARA